MTRQTATVVVELRTRRDAVSPGADGLARFCANCGAEAKNKFCSASCSNKKRAKVTREMLLPYAMRGSHVKVIAYALGVSRATVERALNVFGLHNMWAMNRFKYNGHHESELRRQPQPSEEVV